MSASSDQVTTANLSPDMAIADTTPGDIVLVDSQQSTTKTIPPTHLLFLVVLIAPMIFLGAIAALLLTKIIKITLQSLLAPSTSPTVAAAYNQMNRLE